MERMPKKKSVVLPVLGGIAAGATALGIAGNSKAIGKWTLRHLDMLEQTLEEQKYSLRKNAAELMREAKKSLCQTDKPAPGTAEFTQWLKDTHDVMRKAAKPALDKLKGITEWLKKSETSLPEADASAFIKAIAKPVMALKFGGPKVQVAMGAVAVATGIGAGLGIHALHARHTAAQEMAR
jgi:hypothetical protein